ncbi:hypothetical protein GGS24DRAFT_512355 [Hypoxylon argillaceum]|nr:hypothetical protein GGS24DRAFT_512355 [Hypoxylon argillaceum]
MESAIHSHGDKFIYFSGGRVIPVDRVVDNGMGNGYSVYYENKYIGCGKLVVHDEIDREIDTLNGGPLAYGWVTHFPNNYIPVPDDVGRRYKELKIEFRKHFAGSPLITSTGLDKFITESISKPIYKLAARDPTTQYGLRETEKSSDVLHSTGFDGINYHYPTITSDISYYHRLFPLGHNAQILPYLYPPQGSNSNDQSARGTTPGNNTSGGMA